MDRKNKLSKVLILVFILFSINSFSLIHQNGAGGGYGDGDGDGGGNTIGNQNIESYIIEGSGYFLNSYGDTVYLLNRIEMSGINGINYEEAQGLAEKAIVNLTSAIETYRQLISTAENTPYNDAAISKLKSFDYFTFREINSLNNTIFQEVEAYLKKGDITGTFKRSLSYFDKILGILKLVKEDTALNKMPLLFNLWKLNQLYANEVLFGQYEAQVFNEIL